MTTWVRVLSGLVGLALVITVLDAAIRTFLLPRVASVRLSRNIARSLGFVFKALAHRRSTYAARDKIMSLYPSILLLTYQGVWLAMSLVAFALGFVALGAPSFVEAFELSGSSLFTLGTTVGDGGGQLALTYVEAGVGLTLLALLIAFIPTLYSAFQRREISVSRLSVRAGVPSTPWGVLEIAQSVASYVRLDELWQEWEQWFIEVGETHTTLTILNYYRSPVPNQTWIGAAATVLDAAALFNSAVDLPYPHHPDRTIPIAITRAEFDLVLDHLERSGIPLVSDRDAAWLDFVGWRVNYDAIIEAAYHLFDVPRVDWGLVASQPLFGRSNQRGASGGG